MTTPMPAGDALRRGRESHARRAWAAAFDSLSSAAPLEPPDLERLATAAWLSGHLPEANDALARAHQAYLDRGATREAARAAFWLAFILMNGRDHAGAGGWFGRASRLLDDAPSDCAERGYLLLPAALKHMGAGDHERARTTFEEAASIGDRWREPDLVALARQGAGRAMIRLGDATHGVGLLDEAMVAVVADEVSPVVAGTVYCSVIEACVEIFDVRRAHEWTDALTRWCASQPDLVAYRGECQVRRAEILHLHGQWPDAETEAERASKRLAPPPVGAAFYRLGEIRRLRGDAPAAEAAYRLAREAGASPHPGLALLWLAQGDVEGARAAIQRVADESQERRQRSRVLPAFVEIHLEAGEVAAARQGADELAAIAAEVGTPYLRAVAAQAMGAVLVAGNDARAALEPLRAAEALWRELGVPYEQARVSVLVARACHALGDAGSARLELDAALSALRSLDARDDLARAERALDAGPPAPRASPDRLTPRECEVLRLVATGQTNRAIAEALSISEKTVARHLSNIFTKLDLPSRAAATAYAFKHDLV